MQESLHEAGRQEVCAQHAQFWPCQGVAVRLAEEAAHERQLAHPAADRQSGMRVAWYCCRAKVPGFEGVRFQGLVAVRRGHVLLDPDPAFKTVAQGRRETAAPPVWRRDRWQQQTELGAL